MSIYANLEDANIHVVLAHPLKTKASAKIKSDKVGARMLANLLRAYT